MMPSDRATCLVLPPSSLERPESNSHQVYDLTGRLLHVRVHDGVVELLLSVQLDARGLEAPLPLLVGLGAPAHEPADELLPRRRQQEDELRVREGAPHLPGALQVDLEQHAAALRKRGEDRAAGGAVPEAVVHDRPLEELPRLDHPVELGVVDEVVVDAVRLARAWRPGGRAHREQHLGMMLADEARDGALADRRRSGEHHEAAALRAVPAPRGLPADQELVQPLVLVHPEAAEPLRRRDPQVLHDLRRAGGAEPRDAAEQLADAQGGLRQGAVARRGREHLARAALPPGDLALHLGSRPAGRDGRAGSGEPVDLRRPHAVTVRTRSTWREIASGSASGPEARMLRDAVTTVVAAAGPKRRLMSLNCAPW